MTQGSTPERTSENPSDRGARILNKAELLSHGHVEGRGVALDIIEHALREADPYRAAAQLVRLDGKLLRVGPLCYDLSEKGRIYVLGAGKATLPTAEALEDIIGEFIDEGLIIVKEGQGRRLGRIEVVQASHPIPNRAGYEAAKRIMDLAHRAGEDDIVFCAITGGSSALMPLPVAGITLEEKQLVTQLLLHSGANILEINAVRKHLSQIKGGRLALAVFPAEVINLAVSDVIGDPLDYITGPTVPDSSSFADAVGVLKRYDLWDRVPASVREYLANGGAEQETPKDFGDQPCHTFVVIGGNAALDAAVARATELGFATMVLTTSLEGESREAGVIMATIAQEVLQNNRPLRPPCALLAGGETTVTIQEEHGEGGPSQEFALGAALKIAGLNRVVIAAVDTDGTDGSTDLAGAIVDGHTVERAAELGIDAFRELVRHNSSYVLRATQDAILTGPTHTNVNDLMMILVTSGTELP